ELLRIGEGGVKNPFLPPARDLGAERQRHGEAGVPVTLRELAREQRATVAAAQIGNVLLEKVLFDEIRDDVEQAVGGARDVLGERGSTLVSRLERRFLDELAALPKVGDQLVRGQVQQTLVGQHQILIFEM